MEPEPGPPPEPEQPAEKRGRSHQKEVAPQPPRKTSMFYTALTEPQIDAGAKSYNVYSKSTRKDFRTAKIIVLEGLHENMN